MRLLLSPSRLLQLVAQLLQALIELLSHRGERLEIQLAGRQLLVELEHRPVLGVGRQQRALVIQPALTLGEAFQALLQLLDARLLHFRGAARLGAVLVEALPLFLPGLHGGFGFFQLGGGLFGSGAGQLLFRLEHRQLLAERGQQRAVVAKVRLGLKARLLCLTQIVLQLAQALLPMLDALLDARDVAADRIEATLHLVEPFGQLMVAVPQALDARIGAALFGHQRFEGDLLITDDLLALAHLLVQGLPTKCRQLRLELALLGLVLLILLRRLRLTMQAFELTLQLFAQVGQARQVLVGATDTILGFAPALLVLGDAGCLLDEVAQILGLGLDQLGDHALLDDRIAAWSEAGAEEDIGDVAAPTFHPVEEVGVLRVTGDAAADGDFGEGGVLAGKRTVGVVEDQLDARLGHRLAGVGAVEDDVGHRLAAQVLRRAFAHDPAHGVDDVGFSAAVRADHRRHVAREADRSGIDEGFETGEFDAFQSHAAYPWRSTGERTSGVAMSIRIPGIDWAAGKKPRSLSRHPA